MGLRTRLAGVRSVVRSPSTHSLSIAAPPGGGSVDTGANNKSSSSKTLDSPRRSQSGSGKLTDSPVSRKSRRSVDLLNLRTRASPSPASDPRKSRRSIELLRLPFSGGLRPRRAARAASNVSLDSDGVEPSLSTRSVDASVPPAEPWNGSGVGSSGEKGISALPPRAPSLPKSGSRVSTPERSQQDGSAPFRVPPFTRFRIVGTPEVPLREQRRGAGALLSDGSIVFQVPDRWTAARTEDGFRLVAGACVGYLRATSARDAAVALCDTKRLAVLDAFEVSASPVIDSSGEAVVLVVEYRNYGAGRGLALLEPAPGNGAVVFGLSGPPSSAGFLSETEQQLLGTARVICVPDSSDPSSPDHDGERPSGNGEPGTSETCVVM